MVCFVDLDYAGYIIEQKSMYGFITKIRGAVCSRGSEKQPTVTLSTCKADYSLMRYAAMELLWINAVITEAG